MGYCSPTYKIYYQTISHLILFIIFIFAFICDANAYFLSNSIIFIKTPREKVYRAGSWTFLNVRHLYNNTSNLKDSSKDNSDVKYLDCYNNLDFKNKSLIRQRYAKVSGIYMWLNHLNNKCYIGSSKNLYSRMNNYLSPYYISRNEKKMAICSAIAKYNIEHFSFYILEVIDVSSISDIKEILNKQESFWFEVVRPSYNIQSIINPFSGSNHYRFGQKVSPEVKEKISKSLLGRVRSPEAIQNHILGSRKKPVYCYDSNTGKFLMEFEGVRIAGRALSVRDYKYINYRIDKNKPLIVTINDSTHSLIFKSKKD